MTGSEMKEKRMEIDEMTQKEWEKEIDLLLNDEK